MYDPGGVLRGPAVAGGDLAVHVVGLAARAAARRGGRGGGRAAGGGRGGGAAPGARRGARHGVPALAAERQDPAHLPSQQQAHHGNIINRWSLNILYHVPQIIVDRRKIHVPDTTALCSVIGRKPIAAYKNRY